ncbi:uncharacterized protein [Brachyistius frenatus]|uniref:uncharacterized protein n=1 Tax=Brachyistius frenatus TaxID=100188 RepID=UPI0037E8CC08
MELHCQTAYLLDVLQPSLRDEGPLVELHVGITLHACQASQNPASISPISVNSSAEITCFTSFSEPAGLYLNRRFHSTTNIVYLALQKGLITKTTINAQFTNRIHVTPDLQIRENRVFFQLNLLQLEDTNLYYCSWMYFISSTGQRLSSNGTLIIVRESGPEEPCKEPILDLTLISFSILAFAIFLLCFTVALILRCKRFKKRFRPGRAANLPASNRPQHVCPAQPVLDSPYLITSSSPSDFRRIL